MTDTMCGSTCHTLGFCFEYQLIYSLYIIYKMNNSSVKKTQYSLKRRDQICEFEDIRKVRVRKHLRNKLNWAATPCTGSNAPKISNPPTLHSLESKIDEI